MYQVQTCDSECESSASPKTVVGRRNVPIPRGKPPGHSSLVCHGFETTSHLLIGVRLANEVSRAIQL